MRSLAFLLAIAAIVLLSCQHLRAEVCNGDVRRLRERCMQFCLKPGPPTDPSPECCDAIKIADVACVCDNEPPNLPDKVSLEKVAYIWKFCGRPLESGMKCGSKFFRFISLFIHISLACLLIISSLLDFRFYDSTTTSIIIAAKRKREE